MSLPAPQQSPVDANRLAQALATLGLLYGAREALADAAAGAADEAAAIRAFIRSERAHLLATYELDDLVALVLAALTGNTRAPASIETYCPA